MSFLFRTTQQQANLGLALLRVVTGLVFVMHGYQKLFVMGFAGVSGAFGRMGAPLPGFTGPLFAVCECFFGIAVIVGLFTRLGALWFILDMLGAIAIVHIKNGWSGPGGMEFPVLLLAASAAVFFGGPGAYALDSVIAGRKKGTPSA
jgi:putative oxidoreductase